MAKRRKFEITFPTVRRVTITVEVDQEGDEYTHEAVARAERKARETWLERNGHPEAVMANEIVL